ncbi:hypothetical protein TNCT1_02200 [Streptomyces sp. 1-11]|nr:hypothetical protein TNCT1_02200 [Streptomyces sp. 1-11]
MSRARARRDGRPALIRGPVGPPPRSGIWKAKVRTSKSLSIRQAAAFTGRPRPPVIAGHTYATYSRFTRFPIPPGNEAGL